LCTMYDNNVPLSRFTLKRLLYSDQRLKFSDAMHFVYGAGSQLRLRHEIISRGDRTLNGEGRFKGASDV